MPTNIKPMLASLLVAGATWAQGLAPSKTDQNHDRLRALVGDWNVDVVYVLAGGERRGTAQMHAEWILDRHFVRQDYVASMGQSILNTLQFLGYDPVRKKFTILKMDSLDDAMLYGEGEISADGRIVTLTGERSDMMTRTTARLRQVLTLTDDDHFTLEWYMASKDGGEARTVTMVHSRKKPK